MTDSKSCLLLTNASQRQHRPSQKRQQGQQQQTFLSAALATATNEQTSSIVLHEQHSQDHCRLRADQYDYGNPSDSDDISTSEQQQQQFLRNSSCLKPRSNGLLTPSRTAIVGCEQSVAVPSITVATIAAVSNSNPKSDSSSMSQYVNRRRRRLLAAGVATNDDNETNGGTMTDNCVLDSESRPEYTRTVTTTTASSASSNASATCNGTGHGPVRTQANCNSNDMESLSTESRSSSVARRGNEQQQQVCDLSIPYSLAQQQRSKEEERNFEYEVTHQRNLRVLLTRMQDVVPRGRLSVINLTRRGLGVPEAQLLSEAVILNPQLTMLKLSYNNLGDEGAVILATSLYHNGRHHDCLAVLDLSFNDICDDGAELLALNVIAGNATIKSLSLTGNNIRERGALAISGAILQGTGLIDLHLSANSIGSIGTKAILGAVASNDASPTFFTENESMRSISSLHLGETNMTSDSFIAIPSMLMTNSSLRSLNCAGNSLDDQDILLLSQALTQNKAIPLDTLILSNNHITCNGVENLMNSVWGSQTLKCLKLDNNYMLDRGAQLCAVVLTSVPLESLDVSFNRITTVGIKVLMKNISENNSLQLFSMCGIHIDQNSAKAVSFALAYNMSLHVVRVDSCSAGFAAQRHVVAGIVSNQRIRLHLFTGFPIGPIAKTLGMPLMPDTWSNIQVLAFVRLMWEQWLLKSGRGVMQLNNVNRGPAPPSAVAAASKIAFSSLNSVTLGNNINDLFLGDLNTLALEEAAPTDPSRLCFLEKNDGGTLHIPEFGEYEDMEIQDWIDDTLVPKYNSVERSNSMPLVRHSAENTERRAANLHWLRDHFQYLYEIGRLPYNEADLWQLHQHYFSPPTNDSEEKTESQVYSDVVTSGGVKQPQGNNFDRTISFQSLSDAFTASGLTQNIQHSKRALKEAEKAETDSEHTSKKAKYLKPRISFYPRIMAKIGSLGTRSTNLTLSLLRKLKYIEGVMFEGLNPYSSELGTIGKHSFESGSQRLNSDVEMILLDLL